MIRKSAKRFSEKIMRKQGAKARWRFNPISSRFSVMEADLNQANAAAAPVPGAVFFDGASSRRRVVALKLSDALEIREDGERLARWAFADIRRADSPSGLLRLS
ncbi:DUF7092 domain-containing protein, partial [Mycoplasmoides pneumoniae]